MTSTLKISPANAEMVESFRQCLFREAENLFSHYLPAKIIQLNILLKDVHTSINDLSSLQAPLDIPIPDPPSPDDEEMETDKSEKKKAPKTFIKGNEKITMLLEKVKPEIVALRETILTVACWIQHLIPKIEDGNDFGVAIQEKILERIVAVKTKVEAFQTSLMKYRLDRGDLVAKASKENHVMDYRVNVHEMDVNIYHHIIVIVLDIRSFHAELYDIVTKNLEKVTNPKGEEKPSMY